MQGVEGGRASAGVEGGGAGAGVEGDTLLARITCTAWRTDISGADEAIVLNDLILPASDGASA